MKVFGICLSLLVILLGAGSIHADCGKSHENANPHKMNRISSTSFQDMDADKSGGVSFDEFKAIFPRTSQNGFKMLDKNIDNQLNETEWKAFKDAHKGMGMSKYKS